MAMLARAIRDWQFTLPDAARTEVPQVLAQMALDPNLTPRSRIAAAKVLVEMERANLEARKLGTARQVNVSVSGAVGHLHSTDLSRLSDEELDALQRRLAAERQAALPPTALPSPADPACAQAKEAERLGTPRPPDAP
jgi:hypothetical protein